MILIDVCNLAFRSHYAFARLTDRTGRPTGCIYGFLKAVVQMKQRDNALTFCWDHGLPGDPAKPDWRKVIYPEYKASRQAHTGEVNMAATLVREQLAILAEVTNWLGYRNVGVAGLEADDVISILTHQWHKSTPISVFSSDRDMYQLLTLPGVSIYHKDKFRTGEQIEAELQIPLAKWAMFLAMGGDSSDNIKPLPGMGPKTAARLVLDGADLTKGWRDQPDLIHHRWGKLEPAWDRIRDCYRMALLPTSWTDDCIRTCVFTCPRKYSTLKPTPGPVWDSAEHHQQCYQRFLRFASDHDLRDAIADRWKYFGRNNNDGDLNLNQHDEEHIGNNTARHSHPKSRRDRPIGPTLLD